MSIATAIQNAQQKVASCYTAISNKGGTLPATQNLSNMPTAINSIPSGGGSTKYGASVDAFLGNVNASGVLQIPTEQIDVSFNGVVTIGTSAYGGADLKYKFYSTKIKTITFPDLVSAIKINSFDNLCSYSEVKSASFEKLSSVTAANVFYNAFYACYYLETVYFNALTTTSFGSNTLQFNNMFNVGTGSSSSSGKCTVHFPSNISSVVSNLSGYPTFGGSSSRIVLAFDLPATS